MTRKINYQGRDVEAVQLGVIRTSEEWNQYLLDDGTSLRTKTIATGVFRVDSERAADGGPLYIVQSMTIVLREG